MNHRKHISALEDEGLFSIMEERTSIARRSAIIVNPDLGNLCLTTDELRELAAEIIDFADEIDACQP